MGNLVQIVQDEKGNLYSAHDANLGNIPVSTKDSKLVYDSETKIVYWCYVNYRNADFLMRGNVCGYMSPYISENGKFCRFIDNQIVEIG